jgi:hypothetical protein
VVCARELVKLPQHACEAGVVGAVQSQQIIEDFMFFCLGGRGGGGGGSGGGGGLAG